MTSSSADQPATAAAESRTHAIAKALWLYYTENEPGHKWAGYWDMAKREAAIADRAIEAVYDAATTAVGNVSTGTGVRLGVPDGT